MEIIKSPNGNPLQYYCLEKSHGQRSLVGYSLWGRKESDTTERLHFTSRYAFLVAQMVKHLSTMRETQVQSLGWEDPLEKKKAIHSSILAWKNPMDRGAW